MTLDQRLTTHAIVGGVVHDEGAVGLRHCPVFIKDTSAVKGGEIAHYETAHQAHAGSTATIVNPAAMPVLGRRPASGLVDFAHSSIAVDGAVVEGEHAGVENPAPITRLGYIVSNQAIGQ